MAYRHRAWSARLSLLRSQARLAHRVQMTSDGYHQTSVRWNKHLVVMWITRSYENHGPPLKQHRIVHAVHGFVRHGRAILIRLISRQAISNGKPHHRMQMRRFTRLPMDLKEDRKFMRQHSLALHGYNFVRFIRRWVNSSHGRWSNRPCVGIGRDCGFARSPRNRQPTCKFNMISPLTEIISLDISCPFSAILSPMGQTAKQYSSGRVSLRKGDCGLSMP